MIKRSAVVLCAVTRPGSKPLLKIIQSFPYKRKFHGEPELWMWTPGGLLRSNKTDQISTHWFVFFVPLLKNFDIKRLWYWSSNDLLEMNFKLAKSTFYF